jgi:hypothetical protein
MIWTSWNNGKHLHSGAGYGFKISKSDREKYFNKAWQNVKLELMNGANKITIEANTDKKSFWAQKCGELISKDIGIWLYKKGMGKGPRRKPYKVNVTIIGNGVFRIEETEIAS